MISDAVVKSQMENLDWTFFRRVIFFLGGEGGVEGGLYYFSYSVKKSRFQPFANRPYFFIGGWGGGGRGVVLYRLYSPLLFVGFVFYVRHF